ncbi:hypothetical protein [uncultured Jatrophihabitans sp.]|uniref:hypothetical protein n=1 Tax=uncultured Jatrophihabitans sp. TaxID=1610747 RepID=UPI0035CC3D1A
MTKFLLALHLIFAVFAVGPLVHAATTAGRGIRKADAAATASSARMLRIYGIASALVIISGIVLMYRSRSGEYGIQGYSALSVYRGPPHFGEFSQTWIWLSIVLWALAIALVLFVLVPTLNRATKLIAEGETVGALTGRVAGAGGVVGVLFVVIVVLMVYRPGQ